MTGSPRHVVCPHCSAINRIPPDRPARQAKCGTCHQKLFSGKPVSANAETFERHTTRNDIPVMVDFWAPWCGPCLAMAPAYERAAAELEPDYRQALAARYGIRSIPTLILFMHGREIARRAGASDSERGITYAVEVLLFLIWQLLHWLLFGCKNSQERPGADCEGAVRQCYRPRPAVPRTGPHGLPSRCSAKFGETDT